MGRLQSHNQSHTSSAVQTKAWTSADVETIVLDARNTIPLIKEADVVRIAPDLDIWDSWPVQNPDGSIAFVDGREFWMALAAPAYDDMGRRHDEARIRLLENTLAGWIDHGDLLPRDLNPGSREWAGSAIYNAHGNFLTLFFTAAGRSGEEERSYEQRIFQVEASMHVEGGHVRFGEWSEPTECFQADDVHYMRANQKEGKPGEIKAFRDPAFFLDPRDGQTYLLFTASVAHSKSAFNGAIGIAQKKESAERQWSTLPPLVTADRFNNELERAHALYHNGQYYLFWSTQEHVFSPDSPRGPTGLYGMVADSLLGPYTPLNGTGLVAATPIAEPKQSYSWLVLDTLEVISFIDFWGLKGRNLATEPGLARQQFGGAYAPRFTLRLDGANATIV
ncbi:MAG: glycoside hydrolase family 68 protein [Pseudomonadota bacterium]